MEVDKIGIILYTINYEACVYFYQQVLQLDILYKKETLTCFDLFGTYLLVEIDDEINLTKIEKNTRDKTCIRINVRNISSVCQLLDNHKVEYSYGEYDWGTIAKFRDPDGNLIGFRSSKEHREDIKRNA